MKTMVLVLGVLLIISFVLAGSGRTAERLAPPGFGQTYNEIVSLAKKEGKVRVATSDPDERDAPRFFKPFEDKYGVTVEYIRARGTDSRERVLLEIMAGNVEYDLLHVSEEIIPDYRKAGVVAGPFEWQSLFGVKPIYIDREKYMVSAGGAVYVFMYNVNLVPKDRIPRRWEDMLDPYWKGKFVVDLRPRTFSLIYPAWGKEKLLNYCRALAANNPVWKRGQTEVIAATAAGEYVLLVGAEISSTLRLLGRDPSAKITFSIPQEVPGDQFATWGVLKAAKYPNAALLLGGWLASSEGQKQYDLVDRGSPFEEDSMMSKRIKDAGAKLLLGGGWDYTPAQKAEVSKWILEAWGLPTIKK